MIEPEHGLVLNFSLDLVPVTITFEMGDIDQKLVMINREEL